MPEAGVIYPGMIVVATDSHTTTHGAFGAMGTGCGATDMATILMTGELWFRVPEIIEVRLDGEAQKGVYPKDVILEVLGRSVLTVLCIRPSTSPAAMSRS